jgi:SAM-dependent methyltransferase
MVRSLPSNRKRASAGGRCVTPERLDYLPTDDPLALRSRRDLQRVHRAMRSLSILKSAVAKLSLAAQPRLILELGAGDGTLLLRLAGALRPRWTGVELTLLDRQDLLSPGVREAFKQLDWRVRVMRVDALEWAQSPLQQHYDLCVSTLFLHHFENERLRILLAGVARRVDALIACEPRRNGIARIGSRLIGLLGANEVTREDGIKSVAAGFLGAELTQAWPQMNGDWRFDEYMAWPFTHCFLAAHAGRACRDG